MQFSFFDGPGVGEVGVCFCLGRSEALRCLRYCVCLCSTLWPILNIWLSCDGWPRVSDDPVQSGAPPSVPEAEHAVRLTLCVCGVRQDVLTASTAVLEVTLANETTVTRRSSVPSVLRYRTTWYSELTGVKVFRPVYQRDTAKFSSKPVSSPPATLSVSVGWCDTNPTGPTAEGHSSCGSIGVRTPPLRPHHSDPRRARLACCGGHDSSPRCSERLQGPARRRCP